MKNTPWKAVIPETGPASSKAYVEDSEGLQVCSVTYGRVNAERVHLMAAAPGLLAMLELALRYLNHPDVLEVTKNMALSGEVVVGRCQNEIDRARGKV